MNCLESPKKYISQTSRTFNAGYKKHVHAIRNNRPDKEYSRHILETGRAYEDTRNRVTTVGKERKGKETP